MEIKFNFEFDNLCIGSGAGGCGAIQSIVKQYPNLTIAILEAGPNDLLFPETGNIDKVGNVRGNSKILKEVETVPQKHCNNLKKQILIPYITGGGTMVNDMVYLSGSRKDFDEWPIEFTFDKIGKETKKLDSQIKFEIHRKTTTYEKIIYNGIHNIGLKELTLENMNNGVLNNRIGYITMNINQNKRKRLDPFSTIIRPLIDNNDNVLLFTNCKVLKIIFEENSKPLKAIGVKALLNGNIITIKCNKFIMLCAGTLNSPRILMNSGIGDKGELEENKMEVKYHNHSVGKNLTDQSEIRRFTILNDYPRGFEETIFSSFYFLLLFIILIVLNVAYVTEIYDLFLISFLSSVVFDGMLSSSAYFLTFYLFIFSKILLFVNFELAYNTSWLFIIPYFIVSFAAFLIFNNIISNENARDPLSGVQAWTTKTQFYFISGFGFDEAIRRLIFFQEFKQLQDILRNLLFFIVKVTFSKYWIFKYVFLNIITTRNTKSTGSVYFENGKFNVDPNYLSDERDMDSLMEGSGLYNSFMKAIGLFEVFKPPGYGEYLKEYIRDNVSTTFHYYGTCSMGKNGVVDPSNNLIVYGTSNVGVYDASVFPNCPSTSPWRIVYSVASLGIKNLKLE